MRRLVLYLVMPPILILFVAELTLLGGLRLAYPGESPDPFAPYEAMMPGQWAVASSDFPCDLHTTSGDGIETITCETHPIDGPFDSVFASTYNGRFHYTSFSPNDLVVGDVIRHWGRPDEVSKFNQQAFYMLWNDQALFALIYPVGPVGRFSYRQRVARFAIGLLPDNPP